MPSEMPEELYLQLENLTGRLEKLIVESIRQTRGLKKKEQLNGGYQYGFKAFYRMASKIQGSI